MKCAHSKEKESAPNEQCLTRRKRTCVAAQTQVMNADTTKTVETIRALPLWTDDEEQAKLAKEAKNYSKVDELRAKLKSEGITVKDMKGKVDWALEE